MGEVLSQVERDAIKNAIGEAEKLTSGEIRVHIENHCKEEVLDRAAYVFEQLELQKTKLRNGVLFYLAIKDRQFAILGDVGINLKVPAGFWDSISEQMQAYFKQGQYALGICEGVKTAGAQLSTHFPYQDDDENELPNEVSIG